MAKKRQTKKNEPEKVLVLRTCQKNGDSSHGFTWPLEVGATVTAPDWKPTEEWGNGLHGWLWGSGDWSLMADDHNRKWLVLEVEAAGIVDLQGKVKFETCTILAVENRWDVAMGFIRGHTSYAAKFSKLESSATGHSGHASATGEFGHASATGDSGHASATGYSGHASATGEFGHASATGYSGHASATGEFGWAAAGYQGCAKAAENGVVSILYWDDADERPRLAVGYVGEDGIEADVFYVVENGKLKMQDC